MKDIPELFADLTRAAEDLADLAAEGMNRELPHILQQELLVTVNERIRGLAETARQLALAFF